MTVQGKVDRREFVKNVGIAGIATGFAPIDAAAQVDQRPDDGHRMHAHQVSVNGDRPNKPTNYVFLRPNEAAFVDAALDVFIPKDDVGPGGVESGVTIFIDRQLESAFGRNARQYSYGPYAPGTAQQGYQSSLTPAEVCRIGVFEVDTHCRRKFQRSFAMLSSGERDDLLKAMAADKIELPSIPARLFVETLLSLSVEGYFADPIYGGNRDKGAWRMIGFPGVAAVYAGQIEDYRDRKYVTEPLGIADLA